MSGYEWVCPTSIERRVQYLLKVLMNSKSSKKTLKRDGPKRNVIGFKIIYLKSNMTLGHLGHLGSLNLNKSPTRNYILGYVQKMCFYVQKMCSFSYGCFSSFNLLHLFTLLN